MSSEMRFESDIDHGIEQQKMALLRRNAGLSLAVQLANATIMAVVVGPQIDRAALVAAWWLLTASIALGRNWIARRRLHPNQDTAALALGQRRYVIATLLLGIAWGAASLIFVWGAPIDFGLFAALIIAGMIAGAVPVPSAVPSAFKAFVLPIIPPLTAVVLLGPESPLRWGFAAVTIVFTLAMLASGRYFHQTIDRSIRLGLEKSRMFDNLEEARATAERALSERAEAETTIYRLAYRDALTGLPNRSLLRDRVDQCAAIAHRERHAMALLFLDLDNFKSVNDSFGHRAGDELLIEVGRRLMGAIREADTVGRLGGDEFLVVLSNTDEQGAAQVAEKLLDVCRPPIAVASRSISVSPSIGISHYPKDGKTYDELLKAADTAMYRAKAEGRNCFRFYTEEMNRAVSQRLLLQTDLHRAIDNGQFVLHYQPKYELRSGRLIGLEGLIRWHRSQDDLVLPGKFIPVAEESDLIELIDIWVLNEACRQLRVWMDEGLPSVTMAINFSSRQFERRHIVDTVEQALRRHGVPGAALEIEITERLLARDTDAVTQALLKLQSMGVQIAIDDFGTGYSSLSYLKRYSIDRLKIDRSFVRDLHTDADDLAIATAILQLGHSLGMRVIAEGVETRQQADMLRQMGCDEAQGFHFGKPLTASEAAALLAGEREAHTPAAAQT